MCLEIPLRHTSGLASKFGGFRDVLGLFRRPGGKTMSSQVAPLKGLAHQEQPMAFSTGWGVLCLVGSSEAQGSCSGR